MKIIVARHLVFPSLNSDYILDVRYIQSREMCISQFHIEEHVRGYGFLVLTPRHLSPKIGGFNVFFSSSFFTCIHKWDFPPLLSRIPLFVSKCKRKTEVNGRTPL